MARPKSTISESIKAKRAERLKIVIDEQLDGNQTAFAKMMNYSQQTISCIINGKSNLTESFIDAIVSKFPIYQKTWLLGISDCKTESEELTQVFHSKRDWVTAVDILIDQAVEKNDCKESFYNGLKNMRKLTELRKEITDYVAFKVLQIAKEGNRNG